MALQAALLASGCSLLLSGCGIGGDPFYSSTEAPATDASSTSEPKPTSTTAADGGNTETIASTTSTSEPQTTTSTTSLTSTTTTSTTTSIVPSTTQEAGMQAYCPSHDDFVIAYGDQVQLAAGGWTVKGDGGAATKAAFNLAGGSVEFDLDVSQAQTGVIPNIYSISPKKIGDDGFRHDTHYCDADEGAATWCFEHDWIESNGHCGGATALHTVPGVGPESCNSWGCLTTYQYQGNTKFHMKIDYDVNGKFTITRDNQIVTGYQPAPTNTDFEIVRSEHEQHGAVIYSSQWTGSWVPAEACGKGPGNIANSVFSVSNLRILGAVVQGPSPTRCPQLANASTILV